MIDHANCHLPSKERKKFKKEVEKSHRAEFNAQRREQKAWEKLERAEQELQAKFEEATEAADARHEAVVECLEGKVEELREEKVSMKKDLVRVNARNHREPARMEHAVQKALKHSRNPDTVLPTVRRVKGNRGIVQDWARNAIVTLVNEGVPISKTWSVMKVNAAALGVTIVGRWSTRTSGRVVHEGSFAAGLMIVEYVLSCISLLNYLNCLRSFTHCS